MEKFSNVSLSIALPCEIDLIKYEENRKPFAKSHKSKIDNIFDMTHSPFENQLSDKGQLLSKRNLRKIELVGVRLLFFTLIVFKVSIIINI